MSPEQGAELASFLAPGADRFECLRTMLRRRGLSAQVISVAGKRHIWVRLGAGNPAVILAAHYDRYPGSPGALDNSASCWALLQAASALGSSDTVPEGLFLLFTDGEEAPAGAGPFAQGSYSLGLGLKRILGDELPSIFIFDVHGRGRSLLLSAAPEDLLERSALHGSVLDAPLASMAGRARRAGRMAGFQEVFRFPLPWSDDLGFTMAGLPAMVLTVLPDREARDFARSVKDWLAKPRARGEGRPRLPDEKALGASWPATWRILHGPEDRLDLVEPESLELSARLALSIVAGA